MKNYGSQNEIINVDTDFVKSVFPKRNPNGHKGTFGKALLVCGSDTYRGAGLLATKSALRSGVGLVELFSSKAVCDASFTVCPEGIFTEINHSDPIKSSEIILEKSKNANAILIGCGLGCNENTKVMVEQIVKFSEIPVIIDADGINSICTNKDVLLNAKAQVILTPHPAELGRFCQVSTDEICKNKLDYAIKTAEKYKCVVMAKGAGTYITDGETTFYSKTGNTALSKGGSGDILAGLVGGFVAQGIAPISACAVASFILGYTAEYATKNASERGVLGSDIISQFPYVFKILDI